MIDTGAIVGTYRLVERLGSGAMGAVYKARHIRQNGRLAAIKVVHEHLAEDPVFLQRFEHEAKSASRVRHPNAVELYDYGRTTDGKPYIALEYVEGQTLADYLASVPGGLPLAEVARITRQVAGALDAVHMRGVVHRDLKPENVMITSDGQVKVLDFGIAKVAGATGVTGTGQAIGTPPYMAPEQWRGEQVDGKADQYALGIMVYEMLSGDRPFHSETPVGYLHKHLNEVPRPLGQLERLHLPDAVDDAVQNALAKDPAQRHLSASAFAEALMQATRQRSTRRKRTQRSMPTDVWESASHEKRTHTAPQSRWWRPIYTFGVVLYVGIFLPMTMGLDIEGVEWATMLLYAGLVAWFGYPKLRAADSRWRRAGYYLYGALGATTVLAMSSILPTGQYAPSTSFSTRLADALGGAFVAAGGATLIIYLFNTLFGGHASVGIGSSKKQTPLRFHAESGKGLPVLTPVHRRGRVRYVAAHLIPSVIALLVVAGLDPDVLTDMQLMATWGAYTVIVSGVAYIWYRMLLATPTASKAMVVYATEIFSVSFALLLIAAKIVGDVGNLMVVVGVSVAFHILTGIGVAGIWAFRNPFYFELRGSGR